MDKSPEAFRTISEVAEHLETPAHVLRFWESRFPQVRPVKRAGGRRYYRPSDVALLAGIRRLLHDDGMTIRGVQKVLRDQGVRHVAALGGDEAARTGAAADETAAWAGIAADPGMADDGDDGLAVGAAEAGSDDAAPAGASPDADETAAALAPGAAAAEPAEPAAPRKPAPAGDLPLFAAPPQAAPAGAAGPGTAPSDAAAEPPASPAGSPPASSPAIPSDKAGAAAATPPPHPDRPTLLLPADTTVAALLRALPDGALAGRAEAAALRDRLAALRAAMAERARGQRR